MDKLFFYNKNKYLNLDIKNSILKIFKRLIISILILIITAFFTPNFSINNFGSLILFSLFLSLIDTAVLSYSGFEKNKIVSFIFGSFLAIVFFYILQIFISGFKISWISIILGSLLFGFIDYLI